MSEADKKPKIRPVARPAPAGQIKAMLDGMASRKAAFLTDSSAQAPADLPVATLSERTRFRAVFTVEGVNPSNVTLRAEGHQLTIAIGLGGGFESDDGRTLHAEASARVWERSFRLLFKPVLTTTRVTVTPDDVTVEAKPAR